MVHRQHAVEFAAEGLEEHGVRGIRPFARDAALRRFATAGAMISISSRPNKPALARMRIQRCHGDARRGDTRAAHRGVGERKRLVDALRA